MRHLIAAFILLISTSAQAKNCHQKNTTIDDMALILSRDLGNLQHTSDSNSGFAAIYENGFICFINKSRGAAGVHVTSDRSKVGIADCYDRDNQGYASYDFDLVDGWFTGCELERREQSFGVHTTLDIY